MKEHGRRRILVTGGGSGIGAAVVRRLRAEGAEVDFIFNATRQQDSDETSGPPQHGLQCDLSNAEAVAELCDRLGRGDPYSGFVHAAGASYDCPAAAIDLAAARRIMQINFWSMVALIGAVVRGMTRSRFGRIVAITSVVTRRSTRGNGVYSATKGAIESFLNSLVAEVSHRGVTVNTLAPGYIDTRLLQPYEAMREALVGSIPAGRYGTADEIAGLVAFLCSAEAGYVNGARIVADGGMSAALVQQASRRA